MILEGISRAEALGCVWTDESGKAGFLHNDKMFTSMSEIGLIPRKHGYTHHEMVTAINAHFNSLEKPKWVEPKKDTYEIADFTEDVYADSCKELSDEIARTNARRVIEAFIKANGGSGKLSLYRNDKGEYRTIRNRNGMTPDIGAFCCCSNDLAQAVIDRYSKELALLMKP
jgi:hypothetical protein